MKICTQIVLNSNKTIILYFCGQSIGLYLPSIVVEYHRKPVFTLSYKGISIEHIIFIFLTSKYQIQVICEEV